MYFLQVWERTHPCSVLGGISYKHGAHCWKAVTLLQDHGDVTVCMSVYWVWLSLRIRLTAAQCAKTNISRCMHEDASRWHKHWKHEKHVMKPTTLPNSQSDKNFVTAFPEIQFPEGADHGLLSVAWLQELIHTHFPLPRSYRGSFSGTSVKHQACRWSVLSQWPCFPLSVLAISLFPAPFSQT